MRVIGHSTRPAGFCCVMVLSLLLLTAGGRLQAANAAEPDETAAAETAPAVTTDIDPNAPQPPADPNAVEAEEEADSAEKTAAEDEEEDVFSPRISTLIEIYEAYSNIFRPEFVTDDGRVYYSRLRRKRSDLLAAIRQLDNLNPAILMSLSKEQKIAFWINTYNACTLNLIIDYYPIQHKLYMIFYPNNSIMQISGDWRTKHFFDIQGLDYNLQEIEQEFLLERFNDPRLLFALSYASQGGAMLRNEPYTAETLDAQLDDQVRRYLASDRGIRIDRAAGVVHLSNLFSMFQHKDFFLGTDYAEIRRFRERKPEERAWLNFILDYLPEEDARWLESATFDIKFIKYDWLLNEAT